MKKRFEQFVIFILSFKLFKKFNYLLTDSIFTETRRVLRRFPNYRFGPNRTHQVMSEAMSTLAKYTDFKEKSFLDLGCGKHHPFGNSIIMYLNGAKETTGLDIENYDDESRAAEAMYDLLSNCALIPHKWIFKNISKEAYYERIGAFDAEKLRFGELANGLKDAPLKHVIGSIDTVNIPDNSIDLVTSRSVLEHFLNFEVAIKNLYRFTASGGYLFHNIDIVDHRVYGNSKYNFWSFLEEDENWTDNLCNRLRSSEIKQIFQKVGFEIIEYNERRHPLPSGLRSRLKGRFKEMSDEELSVTGMNVVLRKN